MVKHDYRKLAKAAAVSADNKKAEDVLILDIRKESDLADYMVIVGAQSTPQMRALFDGIEDDLRDLGVKALHKEGKARDRWLVLDYGGLVIHILSAEAREFYRLESLWDKPKIVRWTPE